MHPADYPTAWNHMPTRNSWLRHLAMNVIGVFGWPGVWVALLGISTYTPNWVVWIFMPYFIYGPYRFLIQLVALPWVFRIRRVLREYPWQLLERVPSGLGKYPGAKDDGIWFEFRNPENSDEKVPLVFINHRRSYWWMKRMDSPRVDPHRRAQIEPLWFAGDPRFLAAVAAAGRNGKAPKRLHLLYQRPVFDSRFVPESWGAGSADIERARRAGARRLDVVPQPQSQAGELGGTQHREEAGTPTTTPHPALPWASQPAVHHPPTRRAILRRLIRHAVLLFAVWPALIVLAVIPVASGDEDAFPFAMRIFVVALILLPFNILVAVSALRTHRRLSAHSWRLVECEVVPSASYGWKQRAYERSARHETRVPAVLRLGGMVMRATPTRRSVSPQLSHVWCAGAPGPGAVVSEPGGARPFRLALHKEGSKPSDAVPDTVSESA